jgi:Tat protein secretion system quality control protein TatD with DNase activity
MVRTLDLGRILLETDAPYLPAPGFPVPNHPWNVVEVARYIGIIRNIAPRMVLEVSRQNACRFFGMPE